MKQLSPTSRRSYHKQVNSAWGPQTRLGGAMLDVIGASLVTAMVLVPSVNIMRQSMDINERIQLRQEMVTYCTNVVEMELADILISPVNKTSSGVINLGQKVVRSSATRSDTPQLGGIPGRLLAVSVTVWHDANDNKRMDRNESKFSLFTKAAMTNK